MKIIHCADLHLSSDEKDYSFSVFNEIVDIANSEKADYLLLAGDTFNSFDEIIKLKSTFEGTVHKLDVKCEVFLLAGNHEDIGRNKKKISSFEIGIPSENIIDFDAAPYRLIERQGLEILAIPHQKDYKGYTEWSVPGKKARHRISLAHAANEDLSFTGIDHEDDKACVMDSDLFQRYQVDYAALGHIHKPSAKTVNKVYMTYPGSARVWRKDENGPRYINILECSDALIVKSREIETAGQYRNYSINIDLEGKLSTDIEDIAKEWGPHDWVDIELYGLVEDESNVDVLISKYTRDYEKNVRRIDVSRDSVESCAGISTQEIAKKFLELWEKRKPAQIGDEQDVWQRARELGLKRIKEHMEARS